MLDGSHHTSDSLDISSISRDPLREINILNSPSSMHTFETFRKAKVVTSEPAAPVATELPPMRTASVTGGRHQHNGAIVTAVAMPTVPPPPPPPSSAHNTVDEKLSSSSGDLSLEKEIMAALNSCRVSRTHTHFDSPLCLFMM